MSTPEIFKILSRILLKITYYSNDRLNFLFSGNLEKRDLKLNNSAHPMVNLIHSFSFRPLIIFSLALFSDLHKYCGICAILIRVRRLILIQENYEGSFPFSNNSSSSILTHLVHVEHLLGARISSKHRVFC